jgi:exosortase/archaeosortase family protein
MSASAALTLVTAPSFLTLLDQALGDTFGSLFPAIPFAALLALIFALRWRDLRDVLESNEARLSFLGRTRLVGLAVVATLVALRPFTNQTVESAGIAVVLTFYGTSLVVNPTTRRFILPYAGIFAVGVGGPGVLQWAFGEPLAVLSSSLSAKMVALLGFPVSWQGTQFQLLSKSGDMVSGIITPGCSSIISVTTFLGLLALMHIDMKKDLRSTAILAVTGVGVLTVLNSVRILVLLWVGYQDGAAAFWGVHNWVGYALFLGFYLAALPIYSRMGTQGVLYAVKTGTP